MSSLEAFEAFCKELEFFTSPDNALPKEATPPPWEAGLRPRAEASSPTTPPGEPKPCNCAEYYFFFGKHHEDCPKYKEVI